VHLFASPLKGASEGKRVESKGHPVGVGRQISVKIGGGNHRCPASSPQTGGVDARCPWLQVYAAVIDPDFQTYRGLTLHVSLHVAALAIVAPAVHLSVPTVDSTPALSTGMVHAALASSATAQATPGQLRYCPGLPR
jgi:hypothetical protein